MHRLQTKTMMALFAVMFTLTVVIGLASIASFRDFSMRAATEHTRTAAEILRVALTEAMLNGTIDQRDSLLARIAEVQGLDQARVVRAQILEEQYGNGLAVESVADEIDHYVMQTGKPYYALAGDILSPDFRATIPYVATSDGDVNCLSCHQVPEGSTLGAVTLIASFAHMRTTALLTVLFLVGAAALFAIFSVLFLRRLLQPLVLTATEVEQAVTRASAGDFSMRVQRRTDDEIGQIATHFNQLSDSITRRLSEIRDHVAQLVNSRPQSNSGGDLLAETAATVSGLVKVAQFKQAIEEDESSEEVFLRIGEVFAQEFRIDLYSIYEVDQDLHRIHPVMIDGTPATLIQWCHERILEQSSACRAVRTGHVIDGVENASICRAFDAQAYGQGYRYLCLPVIQSGSVGSVAQLVLSADNASCISRMRPIIEAYLREAAPVLQAKRLMASLRESTLTDAMTGLRNRRFLEEYAETLVNQCKRRATSMTLLMLDLDYFKPVNDNYGHDVGDQILCALADILKANVRESDLLIRYGGEEFLIVLQDTSGEQAMGVAEKIRQAVEAYKFKVGGGVILNKTISIGLADYPNDGQAFWQVLKFADVALYAAKEGGRNQVVRFIPELWAEKESY